ncbi:TlpA disulfide reductase family protein [Lutimonas halocynthiae]|uniref:TlpA family protein disulfide reductase n=1 Tax=Lutimonas halocynthiae TaxID=1446477 RepID=UPI0025B5B94A|nr:TlpA disulfide reductase family protein [Lutimonas halocynthiae]MDN3642638.1 TlpA disulfide reductase family protein [Lutimonas halocynthiae]
MRFSDSKFILLLVLIAGSVQISFSQKTLPLLNLHAIDGSQTNVNELSLDKVVIISFWATWCEPCLKELDAFNENLDYIENDLNAKVLAVSIDDSRTISRIAPMLNGNDWKFEVFIDSNQEVKRTLNIINIPHTVLIYQNQILYESTGYLNGDEITLFSKIKDINRD